MPIVRNKAKISATIDKELIAWIDKNVKTKRFSSRSHGIEYCINECKNKEIQNKQ